MAHGTADYWGVVDADGVLKSNLAVQDLDFMTVRPAYGQAKREVASDVPCSSGSETQIITISGRGSIYSGGIWWTDIASSDALTVRIYSDIALLQEARIIDLFDGGHLIPGTGVLFLIHYDPVNCNYVISINTGVTFESSLTLKVYHTLGRELSISGLLYYALVP